MKGLIYIIIAILLLAYIGDTTITIKPFSVKIKSWDLIISYILVISGVLIMYAHIYKEAQDELLDELYEEVDYIKEQKEKYSEKS